MNTFTMRLQLERVQVSCFASLHMHTKGNQQTMQICFVPCQTIRSHSGPFRALSDPLWAPVGPHKGPERWSVSKLNVKKKTEKTKKRKTIIIIIIIIYNNIKKKMNTFTMRLQLERVQVRCFAPLHMHTQGNQQTM